ncbi:MAG: hypothetical protein J6X81_02520 [Muribaculaceae bacterium]|nr:hypothetical protein [Muribaculaceae bacterium]
MKKIALLIAGMFMCLTAFATDYAGQLTATIVGDPSEFDPADATATVALSGGKYSLTIKNIIANYNGTDFPIGTLQFINLTGTYDGNGYTRISYDGTCRILNGDDPNVTFWYGSMFGEVPMTMTALFNDDDLTANILIDASGTLLGKKLNVNFETLEKYPVKINGVNINSKTATDVLGDGASKVTFNPETKTLTLRGVTLTSTESNEYGPVIEILYPSSETFTIVVPKGTTNSIQHTYYGRGIESSCNLTIKEEGELNVNVGDDYAILMNDTYPNQIISLYLDRVKMTISGYSGGIATLGSYHLLRLNGCNVTSTSRNGTCGISGFYTLDAKNVKYQYSDTEWDRQHGFYRYYNNTYNTLSTVKILPDVTLYPVYINGVQLSSANNNYNTDFDGALKSGYITYTPEDKTLGLNNATIETENGGIILDDAGMTLLGIGANNISSTYTSKPAVQFAGYPATIYYGTFNITGAGGAISVNRNGSEGDVLEFNNCTVKAVSTSNQCAFWVPFSNSLKVTLSIKNSNVKAKCQGNSAINGFKEMVLDETLLTRPEGGYLRDGRIMNSDGTIYNDTIVWEKIRKYWLWVGGERITQLNKDNITSCVTEGNVYFDENTYTLYLEDATIRHDNSTGIDYVDSSRPLTIRYSGDCNINSINASTAQTGISSYGPIKITGNGYLYISSLGEAINHYSGDFTIENANVGVFGTINGASSTELLINASNVFASVTGNNTKVYDGFGNVKLKNCEVIYPQGGATYDTTLHTFLDSNSNPCAMVNIQATALLGDMDGNGLLEVNDVVILAELAMEGGATAEQLSIGDLDGSGTIDVNDVVILAGLVMGS